MELTRAIDDGAEAAPPDQRERADEVLRALAGSGAALRDDQWRAIEALLARRRVLVVQRTGWGKSAVYFVATALLRATGSGPTLIVSPLLALMRNQIAAAQRAGIHARTINSANVEEWDEVRADVTSGRVDVLLVSPERLNNPAFRDDVLPQLAATLGLLVVDEAHCISDWGHDFRPDYRRLRDVLAALRPGVPVLATTATANARVTGDVAEQLGTYGDSGEALVLRGSLERESLRLAVVNLPSGVHRMAWLSEHLGELPGSGIIYTLTVAQSEDTAAFLRAEGHEVASYSGRTDPAERQQAEQDLLANRVKALVATSALGMGFDKPDLGFVIHLGAPPSPIAYYQQVGRAGRALDRAEVVLLPGREDEDIWRYFADQAFPPESLVRRTLEVLGEAQRPMSTAALEPLVELSRGRLEQMLKVLDVDGAVQRVSGGWIATGRPWTYDADRYLRVAAARTREQQAMRDYVTTRDCRSEFLRRQLDDPLAAPCGRCDNCTGRDSATSVSVEGVSRARAEATRPGVEVVARSLWPTALRSIGIDLAGRIPKDESAEPGRAVARFSDLGWGPRLRELLSDEAPDQPVPDDLFGAVIEVLRGWGWPERPRVVVHIPCSRRPGLVQSLAGRIATVGRLTDAGRLGQVRPSPTSAASRINSAQRVRALHGSFRVEPATLAALHEGGGGPVLLVDDVIDTGWTATLAARELRLAGATAVLPLCLALRA